jgi:hypothetical protein
MQPSRRSKEEKKNAHGNWPDPYRLNRRLLGLRCPAYRNRPVSDDCFDSAGDGPVRQCAGPSDDSSIRGRRCSQKEPHQYANNEFRHEGRSA